MTDQGHNRLTEALARGRAAADQLNSATDQLTETIAKIERALEALRFGVEPSIEILREGDQVTHLAFRKDGKRWMLRIDSAVNPMGCEDWQSIPLVNARRGLRVLAVNRLPDLIDAMVSAAEVRLEEVENSRRSAEVLLKTLSPENAYDRLTASLRTEENQ